MVLRHGLGELARTYEQDGFSVWILCQKIVTVNLTALDNNGELNSEIFEVNKNSCSVGGLVFDAFLY